MSLNNEMLADALGFHDHLADSPSGEAVRQRLLNAANRDLTDDPVEPQTAAQVARLCGSKMPLADLTYRRAGKLIVGALEGEAA